MTKTVAEDGSVDDPATVNNVQKQLSAIKVAFAGLAKEGVDSVVTRDGAFLVGGAQSAVTQSEARYRHLINRMAALVVELDPSGKISYLNEEMTRITGFSDAELNGCNWFDLLLPLAKLTPRETLRQQFLESGELSAFRTGILTRGGGRKIISWNSAHVLDAHGSIERLIFFGTDVSAQVLAEDDLQKAQVALEKSRDRYVDLYEFAPVGYLTLTGGALVAEANRTAATLLGIERKQLLDHPFDQFVSAADLESWQRQFAGVMARGGRQTFELTLKSADGPMAFPQGPGGLSACGDRRRPDATHDADRHQRAQCRRGSTAQTLAGGGAEPRKTSPSPTSTPSSNTRTRPSCTTPATAASS